MIRLYLRIYGGLLWLYPPSLRRAHGEEMRQLFRDTLRDEIARRGPPGALRAWGATLADLAASLPREWPREWRQARPRISQGWIRSYPQHSRLSGQRHRRSPAGREFTMQEKFEKFTERARKVLSLAQEEAQRFNHNYIGTEHLLLGLVRERDGVAAMVLSNLDVELEKVRGAVEFIIGRGDRLVLGEIGLTPRAKKVIELAVDEARRLNHHYVGTEHILLGLVREGEGIAAGVLESLGVNLEKVRRATLEVLNQGGGVTPRGGSTSRPAMPAEFGKFTERARKALGDAMTEARAREQREAGTGHMLLALALDQDGLAAQALIRAGLDLAETRAALEQELGPRKTPADQTPHGPVALDTHAMRMIALAADEARLMSDHFVGPEHLLLGIIREADGLGGQTLLAQAADLDQMRFACAQARADAASARIARPRFSVITLGCLNVEVTRAFYIQNFGATDGGATTTGETAVRLHGGPDLALRAMPDDQVKASSAAIEIGIEVADVLLILSTLQDSGVANISEVHGNSAATRWFTVPDPDGRTVFVRAATQPRDA
ncbi:MAG TPA: Clp protease N-terminal domain-containing protein [Ktedonobacterales bacterium]|nr:Clp protease N-terminal domain-containing protein [Ktedonobacterales bacterium]